MTLLDDTRRGDRSARPDSHGRWFARAAVFIVAAALLLRIEWAAAVPVVPLSDSVAYDTFARHLAAGRAYGWDGTSQSAYWPIGTAFIYSVAYRLFDPDIWGYAGIIVTNLLAGMAIVLLGITLAIRWFGRSAGLLTGILLAIWPMHVQFTTVLASELLFTALCLGGIAAWPGAMAPKRLVLAAVLFAAAAYARPTALLLPAVLAGGSILRDRTLLANVAKWSVVTALMLAAIVPWSLRNYSAFGTFVLISTNGGPNLWMGNGPESDGGYRPIPERPPELNEAQFNRMLGQEAIGWIKADPVEFVQNTLVKAVRLHERETIGIAWNLEGLRLVMSEASINQLKWGTQVYWLAILAAALGGVMALAVRQGVWGAITHPAILIWGYFTAVHAVIVCQDRYTSHRRPSLGRWQPWRSSRRGSGIMAWRGGARVNESHPADSGHFAVQR
jgi:hypothetical protein